MFNQSKLRHLLESKGLEIEGPILEDGNADNSYHVFIRVTRTAKGHQRPSSYKLRQLAEEFESKSIIVKFLIVEDRVNDVNATMKAAFAKTFPDIISNVFTTISPTKQTIWVEPKSPLDEERQADIHKIASELLSVLKVENYEIIFTTSAMLPTPTACLNIIRKFSPVSSEALTLRLQQNGFEVPHKDWLDRMLDRLRRSDRIIRLKNTGEYALTLNSLKILRSGKNRRSPDIIRALDLARREH